MLQKAIFINNSLFRLDLIVKGILRIKILKIIAKEITKDLFLKDNKNIKRISFKTNLYIITYISSV